MQFSYWRLSAFYLFYFACLGVWIPFWPLYIEHIGHAFWVIGVTSAVFNSTRVIAPLIWGYLSDRTGRRLSIIRYGCLCAFTAIVGMLFSSDLVWITLILFVFGFFWSAVLPQFEVLTLSHLGDDNAHSYGRVRLWGSIGFVVAVGGGGWLLDQYPMSLFPWVICGTLLMLWVSSMLVPASLNYDILTEEEVASSSLRDFAITIKQRHIFIYLVVVILMQVSFGPYYTFFSVYLVDLGYPVWSIGVFWSIGIAAEILIFVFIRSLYGIFGIKNLLLISLGLSVLRWFLIGGFSENPSILVFVQLLHAFSFGTFHACMVETVRRQFPKHQHGKGQALFNSLGYGLGAVIGTGLSGILWMQYTNQLFYLAASMSALALVLAWINLKRQHFESCSE